MSRPSVRLRPIFAETSSSNCCSNELTGSGSTHKVAGILATFGDGQSLLSALVPTTPELLEHPALVGTPLSLRPEKPLRFGQAVLGNESSVSAGCAAALADGDAWGDAGRAGCLFSWSR